MMKRWLNWVVFGTSLLVTLPLGAIVSAQSVINKATCTYNGKPLYGKIKIVESLPDIKVKIVSSSPDLIVEPVTAFPQRCGQWQFVESFPDLKVQIVENFPDIQIQFVNNFPGVR
ncbi:MULTISPECIES: hypothetical protein [unclassified Coleofasciculus]|uniref:hypothetical protein n=1 Tax=Cyanophyceae TaxID=3028117 RepID=UPI001F55A2A6|nr:MULTISPECIES: hypothetical protein [unclassified Coleofasciculus]